MFDQIEETQWEKLSCAGGSAGCVPQLLRGMVSNDPYVRLDSYDWLMSTIWCDGTIYDSTAEAVPYLVEIVETPSAPCRGRAACALYWIVRSANPRNGAHARSTLAALHAGIPSLIDTVKRQDLDLASSAMVHLVLSYFRGQSSYITAELPVTSRETELLNIVLKSGAQFEQDVLFTLSDGCEDDPMFDAPDPKFDLEPEVEMNWDNDDNTEVIPEELFESWRRAAAEMATSKAA